MSSDDDHHHDDGPLPKTRRLEPSPWDQLSSSGEGEIPWREEETFGAEFASFAAWLSPRRAEKRMDEEILETLRRMTELSRVVQGALAGDPLLVAVKNYESLAVLAEQDDVYSVDFAESAAARRVCSCYFDVGTPVCLVEHVNGARAYVVGDQQQERKTTGVVCAALTAVARCAGLTEAHVTRFDFSDMLEMLEMVSDDKNESVNARRGDEASLELCSEPLYANARGFLANRDGSPPLREDQVIVALAHACRTFERRQIFQKIADRRPRFDEVARVVVAFLDAVVREKRGAGITCDALRKQAKSGTYATGSFIDDNGKFQSLDRQLVEDAKRRLVAGERERETATATRGRDRKETEDNQKVSTALQLFDDEHSILGNEPAAKRQRGGAILKLVKTARPIAPSNGPPPPRTADEQHRAAAADCARLELEEEESVKRNRRKRTLIGGAVPSGALRQLRLRQLANAIVRRTGSRASDHSPRMSFGYSALARRVYFGADAFSDIFRTTTQPIPPSAAVFKGSGDVKLRSGEIDAAIAYYTAAIGNSDHPALYLDRANALLQAGLPSSALLDAVQAFVATPGWRSARARLAECLGAVGDTISLETLVEFDSILSEENSENAISQADSMAAATAAARSAAFMPIDDSFVSAKSRGDAAFRAKRNVQAVEAYTAAIRVAARSQGDVESRTLAAAYSNRAAASAALDSHFDALADGIAAATLASTWVKGHVRTAAALRALRKPRDAIEAYFNALRLLPGDLDLNTGLCNAVEEYRAAKSARLN